ncbi:hypothetical protein I6J18_13615 [Peribacillus psychrosaccharolyticus]|uniref:Uncharacterized protein n=1 Tax=Peribacillus psychrosaccharolyticus TaxID=1407 RepID=A0A974RYQ4_PERPY|nr:hypothetical protein [Peribacillus psychrosaccharolyticus]MED3745858.1 hypothetical protein [Peribacillus psychrosaccharolyticus]QQS98736.1 hypothetical protein I6J18_13615 [Peribacillus psychrosaccharolyticus]
MFKRNKEIRQAKGDIPLWAIAERLGVHENTFYNWMKTEMIGERRQKVIVAIKEIREELQKD